MNTLTLEREGAFRVTLTGDSHCGVGDQLSVRYHVTVTCGVRFDQRGFLFDQLNLDAFFQRLKRTSQSCEKLTLYVARELHALILAENPACDVRTMIVKLSPEPFAAAMTYRWNLGET
jgi:hypothetical protein